MFLNKLYHLNIYTFLVSIHLAIIIYAASTFLSGIFGQEYIWIIYSIAALLALCLNFSITSLLKNFRVEKLNNLALLIAFLNLLVLNLTTHSFYIFIAFIIYIVLSEFLILQASIMVEDLSKDQITGGIRGRFISMQSLAYIASPFITAMLIKNFGIESIFLFSAMFILIAFIYFKINVVNVPIIKVHNKNLLSSIEQIWKNYDLRIAILSLISLNLFFVAAVVYIPFKMAEVGIELNTYLSVLLPIALIPFLFMPRLLGYIEDKMKNEKLFITIGIIGLLIILGVFALTNSNSIFIWAIILFISRVFSSMAETSINSYFFKKIDRSQTTIISIFASSSQIAYLLFSPILAFILVNTSLETVFLSISFFLCFVLLLVSKIHNTDNYEKHKSWTEIWRKSKNRLERR